MVPCVSGWWMTIWSRSVWFQLISMVDVWCRGKWDNGTHGNPRYPEWHSVSELWCCPGLGTVQLTVPEFPPKWAWDGIRCLLQGKIFLYRIKEKLTLSRTVIGSLTPQIINTFIMIRSLCAFCSCDNPDTTLRAFSKNNTQDFKAVFQISL